VLASCMLVDLNIWCVYVGNVLNICILLHIWLLVFIHINIYPFLTKTLTFTWKESARQSRLCVKGVGGIYLLQKKCFNKSFFSIFCYNIRTWSGILNLIKIIHAPQSITMKVTPPCLLRAALFRPCVLRTAMFWLRVLRTV